MNKRIATLAAGVSLAASALLTPHATATEHTEETCAEGQVWVDGFAPGDNWYEIPEGHRFHSAIPADAVVAEPHEHGDAEEGTSWISIPEDAKPGTVTVTLELTAPQGQEDTIPEDAELGMEGPKRFHYIIERSYTVEGCVNTPAGSSDFFSSSLS